MARHRKVAVSIWNDKKFTGLSDDGKLLFLYLLTHPHQTSLGAMQTTMGGLADERGWLPGRLSEAFLEVSKKGMVKYDPAARCLWLPNFLKYNGPESPNVVKAWFGALDLIPECQLKTQAIQNAKAILEDYDEAFRKAFDIAFRKAFPKGVSTTQTLPSPYPEPEPEPYPEQKICTRARENGEGDKPREPPDANLTEAEHHEHFERIKAAYPKFAGRQDWLNAQHFCRLRIQEGETWAVLLAAVERYAAHIRAKRSEGTQYVKTPGRFFEGNNEDACWRQEWAIPARKGENGAVAHVPTRTADEIELDAIRQCVKRGLSDEAIADELALDVERVHSKREELQRAEH